MDEFMKLAYNEAKKARDLGEVPVGAIIVKNGKVLSKAHNLVESLKDPTAHAEMIAIKLATKNLGNWRLSGCEMYVTLEPCSMCAGAILLSRISRVHIGTFDENTGACGSVTNIIQNPNLNHFLDVKWYNNEECGKILTIFFKSKRG